MQKRSFGQTKEGREVTEYTLVNAQGMTLSVIDLGATIVSITIHPLIIRTIPAISEL